MGKCGYKIFSRGLKMGLLSSIHAFGRQEKQGRGFINLLIEYCKSRSIGGNKEQDLEKYVKLNRHQNYNGRDTPLKPK